MSELNTQSVIIPNDENSNLNDKSVRNLNH